MSQSSTSLESLQFFGRVSASVSHEIKNVFAVINESAGLIEDFTLMAERGMPLQPERLKKAANSIQGQIQRGDTIIKNMNAFAHSIDEETREVDLVEVLTLTIALSTRMADMQQIRLTMGDCEPVVLSANPFGLIRLLHSSLAAVLPAVESGETLRVGVKPDSGGACFSLVVSGKAAPRLDGAPLASMAGAMGLSATISENNGVSELRIAVTPETE